MKSCIHMAGMSGLLCRSAAAPALMAALMAVLMAVLMTAASADEWTYLADPDQRQIAHRDGLRAAVGSEAPGAPSDRDRARLVANAVGIAAAGCGVGGAAAEARHLTQGLADALAHAVPSDPHQVQAHIAAATCALADDAPDAARAAMQAAAATARALEDPADRDRLIGWVADVAGASGALPADAIIMWAGDVVDARARAAVMRGWALARFVDDPANPLALAPVAPFAPFAIDSDAAVGLAFQALDADNPLAALQLAAAVPTSVRGDRREILKTIYQDARAIGDYALSRMAAMAAAQPGDQKEWLAALAVDALDDNLPAEAALIAGLMAPSRDAINVWLQVAGHYRDDGYPQMVTDALDEARRMAESAEVDDRPSLLARVAGRAAQLDEVDRAALLLADLAPSDDLAKAISDLAKRLAELGRIDEAVIWAARIDDPAIDVILRSRAFGSIAKAQAESGDIDAAVTTIDSRPDLAGRYRDRGLRAIAVALAESGEIVRAERYLPRINDPEERSRAETEIARVVGQEGALDRFEAGLRHAAMVDDPEDRDALLLWIGEAMLAPGGGHHPGDAIDGVEAMIASAAMRARLHGQRLATEAPITALADDLEVVVAAIDSLDDPRAVALASSTLALRLATAGALRQATSINRGIRDWRLRLTNFRTFAEQQAARLDVHRLIEEAPDDAHHVRLSADTVRQTSDDRDLLLDRAGLAVFALPRNDYDRWAELIGFGDRLGPMRLTSSDIRAQFPAPDQNGRVHRMTGLTLAYNRKFTEIEPVIGQARAQGEPLPQIIYVEEGVVSLSMVREQLLRRGAADYLTVRDGVYTLRRPLVVGPHATLLLTGGDVRELRMSTRHHVYLVAAGALLVADTTITSWDVETDTPTEIVKGENDYDFRPFVATWSGSRMLATRAIFRALGYNNRKSFGLGFSAGPHDYSRYGTILDSPEATLVENLFERMYYGFYSRDVFTADIIGNEYRNSVVYGPDPHDYSEDILMAYNTAYGTKVKHGLIVSREVDGIFVGNIAFDNHGSGIMLDRLSNHSIIYANTVFDNENDGIAVYETACAIVANNAAFDNALSGVRIRNSVDVAVFDNDISDNGEAGIVLYIDDLAAHVWRNLELDPFWTITTATIADNRIVGNGNAIRATDTYAVSMADNLMVENGRRPLVGDFDPIMGSLIRQTHFGEDPLMLSEPCLGPVERYVACGFRELGVFDTDGQAHWDLTGDHDVCAGEYRLSNTGLVREVSN